MSVFKTEFLLKRTDFVSVNISTALNVYKFSCIKQGLLLNKSHF